MPTNPGGTSRFTEVRAFRRVVDQVHSVFCFKSEKLVVEPGRHGLNQRMGNTMVERVIRDAKRVLASIHSAVGKKCVCTLLTR